MEGLAVKEGGTVIFILKRGKTKNKICGDIQI